jgi:hypothetical protein
MKMFTDEKKTGEIQIDEIGHAMLRAADLLERHGHTKHQQRDRRTGGMCWSGALYAAGEHPSNLDIIARRMGFESEDGGTSPTYVAVRWNNQRERTGADVVARLRRFAVIPCV